MRHAVSYTDVVGKFRGTIRRSDLEGGLFQLEAEDGNTYELEGEVDTPALTELVDAHVEVDGAVDRNALSFTMTGPRLKVRTIRKA